nr:FAD-dependent monooxygenase [Bradyrhizobium cosmicum]
MPPSRRPSSQPWRRSLPTDLTGSAYELTDPIFLARYQTSHLYANRFSQGRAFIAGDAAHVHVPIGGQSMSTGIQGAFNSGRKLAGRGQGENGCRHAANLPRRAAPMAEGLIRGTDFAYPGAQRGTPACRSVVWAPQMRVKTGRPKCAGEVCSRGTEHASRSTARNVQLDENTRLTTRDRTFYTKITRRMSRC